MCLPSFPNLISEIDAMISVKKDLEPGASCSSNLYEHAISYDGNKDEKELEIRILMILLE